jgi:hypothetical protein
MYHIITPQFTISAMEKTLFKDASLQASGIFMPQHVNYNRVNRPVVYTALQVIYLWCRLCMYHGISPLFTMSAMEKTRFKDASLQVGGVATATSSHLHMRCTLLYNTTTLADLGFLSED